MATIEVKTESIRISEVVFDETIFNQDALNRWRFDQLEIPIPESGATYEYYSKMLIFTLQEIDCGAFVPGFGYITRLDFKGEPFVWPLKDQKQKQTIMPPEMFVQGVTVKQKFSNTQTIEKRIL